MKTAITVVLAATLLTGCGWVDRQVASVTGGATETCVGGVLYLQFTSGASVAYNPDGTIKQCK